jgi:hypothetical protein
VEIENSVYLKNIAERLQVYRKTREITTKYILMNNITETPLLSQLIVMAFVWTAFKRNEVLRDSDIVIFTQDISFVPMDVFTLDKTYALHVDHHDLTLEELLDETVYYHRTSNEDFE